MHDVISSIPRHVDFSYEVSRALTAVEGSCLLVDATQGVRHRRFSVLSVAKELNLVIIPVVSKIDSPMRALLNQERARAPPRIDESRCLVYRARQVKASPTS